MKKEHADSDLDDMRPEYDFSQGVRNKYADRLKRTAGCFLVAVDLELRPFFPDDKAVNAALRGLLLKAKRAAKAAPGRKSA